MPNLNIVLILYYISIKYLVAIKTFIRRFDDSILCPFIASIALKASDAFEYFMYATPKN